MDWKAVGADANADANADDMDDDDEATIKNNTSLFQFFNYKYNCARLLSI